MVDTPDPDDGAASDAFLARCLERTAKRWRDDPDAAVLRARYMAQYPHGQGVAMPPSENSESPVKRNVCNERHKGIDDKLDRLEHSSKQMFWLQLSNLGAMVAFLGGLVGSIVVSAVVYAFTVLP